ncbi:MAG: TolB-like 6-bladed beta-propeller domain-containing protein, partial [Prevotellaceae bacterium]|jgi:hypothetical protein|nr:TolB-like 6-bladed beta-propeller domain-containing protein [Prevotellaceae bacterium]
MKRIFFIPVIFLFVCCNQEKKDIFNGEVYTLEDTLQRKFLHGTHVILDGVYDGYMSVYDSLVLFESYKYPAHFCNLFSLHSGKHLGDFFRKGQGPDEFLDFSHSEQYFNNNGEIQLLGFDALKGTVYLINLTKSIITNTIQCDTVIATDWNRKHTLPCAYMFRTDKDHFVIRSLLEYSFLDKKDYKLGAYYLYGKSVDSIEKTYILYNRVPDVERVQVIDQYLSSMDMIRPDNSKIAMAMKMLAQINILDLRNGKLTGFRIKNTPDYPEVFRKDYTWQLYYADIRASDKYIFALYSNTHWDNSWKSDEIHVFDWDGNWLHKITLDQKVFQISFDPVNELLYGLTDMDEVYRYEINKVLKNEE